MLGHSGPMPWVKGLKQTPIFKIFLYLFLWIDLNRVPTPVLAPIQSQHFSNGTTREIPILVSPLINYNVSKTTYKIKILIIIISKKL